MAPVPSRVAATTSNRKTTRVREPAARIRRCHLRNAAGNAVVVVAAVAPALERTPGTEESHGEIGAPAARKATVAAGNLAAQLPEFGRWDRPDWASVPSPGAGSAG